MYKFIDTIEVSEGALLPSEALKLNGEFIENLIPGYRTLHVAGREALSPELMTYETGVRDGSTLQNKRFPARSIIVTYQLRAETNEAFREAYNALGGLLNVEDAELIFNDELDKYYTGTPATIGEVEPGRNSVIGEIEFFCVDPFKYSVVEYEASPTLTDGTGFVVDYKGTYKSFPTLEAKFYEEEEADGATTKTLTGNGECGYVAFFNEEAKIIQLGDPEEGDGEGLAKSQTLVTQAFTKSTSWGSAVKNLFTINNGTTSSSSVEQKGSFKLEKPSPQMEPNSYFLVPADFGTGTGYHGPSLTRAIPKDASGVTGAENFTFTWKQKMCIGYGKNDTKQRGAFQMQLADANGHIIAGVNIFKGSDGKKAKLRFYVGDKIIEEMSIDLSYRNKYFGNNEVKNGKVVKSTVKTSSIKKEGGTFTFNIGGIKRTFKNANLAASKVTKITATITKYGSKPALTFNGLYYIKFTKNNCETWRDILNKFSANDIVVADCKEGKIYLNNSPTPEYGALGNDWEEFYLKPGVNQIGVSWSDWVKAGYEPTCKLRYREVFL